VSPGLAARLGGAVTGLNIFVASTRPTVSPTATVLSIAPYPSNTWVLAVSTVVPNTATIDEHIGGR
jgi:hypothetical protein